MTVEYAVKDGRGSDPTLDVSAARSALGRVEELRRRLGARVLTPGDLNDLSRQLRGLQGDLAKMLPRVLPTLRGTGEGSRLLGQIHDAIAARPPTTPPPPAPRAAALPVPKPAPPPRPATPARPVAASAPKRVGPSDPDERRLWRLKTIEADLAMDEQVAELKARRAALRGA